jgi:hypothetical protein
LFTAWGGEAQTTVMPTERPILWPILIGRASHLDALTRAVEQAALGMWQAVLVADEAGVGKSRLLPEAARRAQGFSLLQAHGSSGFN